MKRFLLILFPLSILITVGFLLLAVLQSPGPRFTEGERDPNRGYEMRGKTAYLLKYEGDKIEYSFEGREADEHRSTQSVYDPSNWQLLLFPREGGEARFEVLEGELKVATGYLKSDGIFRVDSYRGGKGEIEFWQTLFNMAFLLPRNTGDLTSQTDIEVEFPSLGQHRIIGKAGFRSLESRKLGGVDAEVLAVDVHLEILNKPTADRITEFFGEGVLYYDAARSRILAGEWEWASGLEDQIYLISSSYNYILFYLKGFRPKDTLRDYLTASTALAWDIRRMGTQKEWAIKVFESAARNMVFTMAEAQEAFKKHALVDQDADGKGEYGLLEEVSQNAARLRAAGGFREWPLKRPDIRLRDVYGRLNRDGYSTVDCYNYKLFLNSHKGLIWASGGKGGDARDADLQEKAGSFCIWAWPESHGTTGNKVFFADGSGKVWSTLTPPFDPATELPKPESTARPEGVEWAEEEKGKRVVRETELVTLRGEAITGEAKDRLKNIIRYQIDIHQYHLDRVLTAELYRKAGLANRALLKARCDGRLTVEEARDIEKGFGEVVFRTILAFCQRGLSELETMVLDEVITDTEDQAEIKRLRTRFTALKALKAPAVEEAQDFYVAILNFVGRAEGAGGEPRSGTGRLLPGGSEKGK
jgi:hypothetical protein